MANSAIDFWLIFASWPTVKRNSAPGTGPGRTYLLVESHQLQLGDGHHRPSVQLQQMNSFSLFTLSSSSFHLLLYHLPPPSPAARVKQSDQEIMEVADEHHIEHQISDQRGEQNATDDGAIGGLGGQQQPPVLPAKAFQKTVPKDEQRRLPEGPGEGGGLLRQVAPGDETEEEGVVQENERFADDVVEKGEDEDKLEAGKNGQEKGTCPKLTFAFTFTTTTTTTSSSSSRAVKQHKVPSVEDDQLVGALHQAAVDLKEDQPVDGHPVQAEEGDAAKGDGVEEVVLPVQADQQRIEGAVALQGQEEAHR
ncbi:hypothetical protein TYRP_008950 [Tyrophagus putrescentiae]|nr:hypothetical protein TYRP_008950 [Tyrophagus putrescentiae]